VALIRERFARPIMWIAVTLVVAANSFNIGADLGSIAEAFRLLVPVPFFALVVAMAALILSLEVFISYERYARILRWLTLSILAYVMELFVVNADCGEIAAWARGYSRSPRSPVRRPTRSPKPSAGRRGSGGSHARHRASTG
jgi:Mn2+/Fe2+ NRAMP family transporter